MASIWDMPDELLELVMSYLPLADRKNARLVCRRWRHVSYSTRLVKNDQITLQNYSDLNKLHLSRRMRYNNIKILNVENGLWEKDNLKKPKGKPYCQKFWSKYGKLVNELTMLVVDIQIKFLKYISSKTPNLVKLSLCESDGEERWNYYSVSKITDLKVSPSPLPRFPRLVSLKVTLTDRLSGDQLRALTENAPVLKDLTVIFDEYCYLQPDLIDALTHFTSCRQNILKRLMLQSCNIQDTQLIQILSNVGQQMMELHLLDCHSLTNRCFPVICNKFPNLRKISLTSGEFSDQHLRSLLESLLRLTHVSLTIVGSALLTVSKIASIMKRLCSVSLSTSFMVDFWEHCPLYSGDLHNLTEFCLFNSNLTDTAVEVTVKVLPHLLSLNLNDNNSLTKLSVEHIVRYCKSLRVLSLRRCCFIENISPLADLKHLQKLDVRCCDLRGESIWEQLGKVEVKFGLCLPKCGDVIRGEQGAPGF